MKDKPNNSTPTFTDMIQKAQVHIICSAQTQANLDKTVMPEGKVHYIIAVMDLYCERLKSKSTLNKPRPLHTSQ